jgi:hypothetical protein
MASKAAVKTKIAAEKMLPLVFAIFIAFVLFFAYKFFFAG